MPHGALRGRTGRAPSTPPPVHAVEGACPPPSECSTDATPTSAFLRELCYFARPAEMADTVLLAAACRVVLGCKAPAAGAAAGSEASSALVFCTQAAGAPHGRVAQRLLSLCLQALALHSASLAPALQQPRRSGAESASGVVPPLVELLIVLTSPDSWKAALGLAAAGETSASVLAYLLERGLFEQLGVVATAASAGGAQPPTRGAVPAGEALATALTVRYLAQQSAVDARLQQRERTAHMQAGLVAMLSLECLVHRCPTLRPAIVRLWRHALAMLQRQPAGWLQAWVRQQPDPAAVAAALLGNLLEHAPSGLHADNPSAARQLAAQFISTVSSLLRILPLEPFFPVRDRWGADDDAAPPPARTEPSARLVWRSAQPPSSGNMGQLQLVSHAGMLQAVVRALLPHVTSPAEALALPQLQQVAGEVHLLCAFLQQLLELPGQRQRVLIALAVSVDFVQRMWFSFLGPMQAAGGAGAAGACCCTCPNAVSHVTNVSPARPAGSTQGWVPAPDTACDPGWMLPLSLFCLAYSSFIITGERAHKLCGGGACAAQACPPPPFPPPPTHTPF